MVNISQVSVNWGSGANSLEVKLKIWNLEYSNSIWHWQSIALKIFRTHNWKFQIVNMTDINYHLQLLGESVENCMTLVDLQMLALAISSGKFY